VLANEESPFMYYSLSKWPKIKAAYPAMSVDDIAKELSVQWNILHESSKAMYTFADLDETTAAPTTTTTTTAGAANTTTTTATTTTSSTTTKATSITAPNTLSIVTALEREHVEARVEITIRGVCRFRVSLCSSFVSMLYGCQQ
jgi:hypothetical protein